MAIEVNKQAQLLCLAAVSLVLLFSCTLPGTRQLEQPLTENSMISELLNPWQLTADSSHYLQAKGLALAYQQDPDTAIRSLQEKLTEIPSLNGQLTLMELCVDQGGQREKKQPDRAVGYFFAAAEVAMSLGVNRADPASEVIAVYNHSAGQVTRLLFESNHGWDTQAAIEGPWKAYLLHTRTEGGELLDPDFFDTLLPADYLELKHTEVERIRRNGVGSAMVGHRKATPEHQRQNPFLAPVGISQAVNATLDFSGGEGRVELAIHDLAQTGQAQLGGHTVALAADLTAPLVFLFDHIDEPRIAWKGLLHPDDYIEYMKIFQLEPFQADKIPVIFLHGLISSPAIWLPAFNELNADPLLREHFQLLAFVYPTGFPIAYSAAALRTRLQEFQDHFDPEHNNPNMQNLLLVGHSMGGVLSSMQIRSSNDTLESTFLKVPLDELKGVDEDQRAALKALLVYEANPNISRTVFVATPHRGSEAATGPRGSIGSRLIEDPTDTVLTKSIPPLEGLTEEGRNIVTQRMNGIESLKPYSPELMAILNQSVRQGVAYHSIIGRKKRYGLLEKSSDGTVPYWSSHIDGAESEKVVQAKHTPIAKNRDATEEMRRILYRHAGLPER